FFQMTKVMDIMEDFLKMMGWKYLHFDGGMKMEECALHIQQFNASQMSTRAGGLGLNLQAADTVIMCVVSCNRVVLSADAQAYRIGQTRAVHILCFIKEKSVEEAMRNDKEVGKKVCVRST
ncbi:P-loop containing nucleoside triphosphate hydrolase protein, partial [Suillus subluteus]